MLVQFKFKNFKCFKDEAVLNLVASNYFTTDRPENVIPSPFYSVVKSVSVFGANASGKTKLIQAFDFMQTVVLLSANNNNNFSWQKKYSQFKLNTQSLNENSVFEVVFILDDIQYRYGFELNQEEIASEWLFRKKTKEINILYRDNFGTTVNKRYINDKIFKVIEDAKMVRKDVLYLSALAFWNDSLSSMISHWFADNIVLSTSLDQYMGFSLQKLDDPQSKSKILSLLKSADTGIDDIFPNEIAVESIPEEIKKMIPKEALIGKIFNGVKTIHKQFDENHLPVGVVELSMEQDESYGTSKMFALSAPIIEALERGKVLWIDEIDSGLHYLLLQEIIKLFYSESKNPHNAQLIINSQNIDLIDKGLFRRDQIYLTSKNVYGESSLQALTDFSLRKDAKIGDLYRKGLLGGIPYLSDFAHDLNTEVGDGNETEKRS